MISLTFKQTNSEIIVRAAATVLFSALARCGVKFVSISELAERPQYGFTASAAIEPVGPRLVRITDLQDGRIDWDSVPFCECAEPEKYLLQNDDLLFARTGATTGKTHLVRKAERAVFASYLIRLRPKRGVSAGYLHAFFQSDNYWTQISEEKEGSAQPNVNGEKLGALQVPLVELKLQRAIAEFLRCVRARQDGERVQLPELPSPLPEQRRVVARIEELAAQIHAARTLRHQAAEQAEVLVANQIKAVFERGQKSGWRSGNLGDYVLDDCYGSSEKTHDDTSGTPVLRMGNIQNGRLDLRDLKYLHIAEKDRAKLGLRRGDIVVNRTNSAELVGKCAVFDLERDFAFASYLIRLRLEADKADPHLVASYINSPAGRAYMFTERKQMTGQANVNATKLKALPIALPPLSEQRRILSELDALQAEVDALKGLQTETAAELDALMPAILDKAFKGEL
ncbi:MAG TPA: restriction endonuclease subunit S [Candidatus Acidoferrum sp.]|nr:restriction endonuclease subunit S [Candidatus Acidoferrum sp.]